MIKKYCFLWIAFLVVVLDQLSKCVVVSYLMIGQSKNIFPFINITLAHNLGAAFSFLHDAGGIQQYLFIGIAVVMSIVFIREAFNDSHNILLVIAVGFILGGAWGNVIDRVMLGYVIDFIDVFYGSWHFATFNIADSAITVGAGLWVLLYWWDEKKNKVKGDP